MRLEIRLDELFIPPLKRAGGDCDKWRWARVRSRATGERGQVRARCLHESRDVTNYKLQRRPLALVAILAEELAECLREGVGLDLSPDFIF